MWVWVGYRFLTADLDPYPPYPYPCTRWWACSCSDSVYVHFHIFQPSILKLSFPIISLVSYSCILLAFCSASRRITRPWSREFSHNFASCYSLIQPGTARGHYSLSSPFGIPCILSSTLFLRFASHHVTHHRHASPVTILLSIALLCLQSALLC